MAARAQLLGPELVSSLEETIAAQTAELDSLEQEVQALRLSIKVHTSALNAARRVVQGEHRKLRGSAPRARLSLQPCQQLVGSIDGVEPSQCRFRARTIVDGVNLCARHAEYWRRRGRAASPNEPTTVYA